VEKLKHTSLHFERTPFYIFIRMTSQPQRVFLYRVMTDAGVAPNIQHNICSLAICKPQIRKSAKVGDIIIGLRARSGELGALGPNADDSVLYCMQVTKKILMEDYETYCKTHAPMKIPSLENLRGDCQYTSSLSLLPFGPHGPSDIQRDLGGKYVLLAEGPQSFQYRKDPVGHRLSKSLSTTWDVACVKRGHHVKSFTDETRAEFADWLKRFPISNTASTQSSQKRCGKN
jgi:hypothetical protein